MNALFEITESYKAAIKSYALGQIPFQLFEMVEDDAINHLQNWKEIKEKMFFDSLFWNDIVNPIFVGKQEEEKPEPEPEPTPDYTEQIAKLRKEYAKIKKAHDTLEAKVYKKTNRTVIVGEDEREYSISAINERRRQRNLDNYRKQLAEYEADLKGMGAEV
jgi:hypothetical protein